MSSDLGWGVSYNSLDLPWFVYTWAGTTELHYDAFGNRVSKYGPDSSTIYVGDLYEQRQSASGLDHVFHVYGPEGEVLQITEADTGGEEVHYLHPDHLGSLDMVTDETGAVVERIHYAPWGRRVDPASGIPIDTSDPRFHHLFTGHEQDDDEELTAGLINMKGRAYDPLTARFLTPDPLIANPLLVEAYNAYSYVDNNPVTFTDPTGMSPGCSGPYCDSPGTGALQALLGALGGFLGLGHNRGGGGGTGTGVTTTPPRPTPRPRPAPRPANVDIQDVNLRNGAAAALDHAAERGIDGLLSAVGANTLRNAVAPHSHQIVRAIRESAGLHANEASAAYVGTRLGMAGMEMVAGTVAGAGAGGARAAVEVTEIATATRVAEAGVEAGAVVEAAAAGGEAGAEAVAEAAVEGAGRTSGASRTLFHGTLADNVIGILRAGGFIPRNGRVFFSEVVGDTFQFGADVSRGAAFSIEVDVQAANVVRTSTPGVPRTVIVESTELVPAQVRRMFIRTPDGAGGFSIRMIEGAAAIRRYFGL